MLKISREIELALLLLTDLVRNNRVIKLKNWSEKRGLPYRFLSKVAVKLKNSGILESKEGREGGYWLAKKAKKVKLSKVIRVFENSMVSIKCMTGEDCACLKFCGHRNLMGKLSEIIEKQLNKTRIEDLC